MPEHRRKSISDKHLKICLIYFVITVTLILLAFKNSIGTIEGKIIFLLPVLACALSINQVFSSWKKVRDEKKKYLVIIGAGIVLTAFALLYFLLSEMSLLPPRWDYFSD